MRDLEAQQASPQQQPSSAQVREANDGHTQAEASYSSAREVVSNAGDFIANEQHIEHNIQEDATLSTTQSPTGPRSGDDAFRPAYRAQETLAGSLRSVSLAAMAEPYLGTISGLTFARLTQAVLRRLSPDGRDFVFSPHIESNTVPLEGATDLHLDLVNSMYFDFDQAIDFSVLAGEGIFPLYHDGTEGSVINLPSRTESLRLATFYFDHSHNLYPIIDQQEAMSALHMILQDPEHSTEVSSPNMFRVWMMLAIGSTTYSSITLTEESVSRLYYEKAMTYFEASLDHGDMVSTSM